MLPLRHYGWKNTIMFSKVSFEDFLSQKYIFKERYSLSKNDFLLEQYSDFQANSKNLFFNQQISIPDLTIQNSKKTPKICEWFTRNASFEIHRYDFSIPTSYVTPLDFYYGVSTSNVRPWDMILFVYNPQLCEHFDALTHPKNIQRFYQEKDEPFLPKSFFIEDLEIGWIGYDEFESFIFVHHFQLKGSIKGLLDRNSIIWFYRIMARSLPQFFKAKFRKPIIVPDASTYDKITKRATQNSGISYEPYSHHVLKKSGYSKIDLAGFDKLFPGEYEKMILKSHLNADEVNFWHFPKEKMIK